MQQIKIDIGCGNNKKKGFIGIDLATLKNVDIICNIEKEGLPFKSKSIDEIFSSHFLEHVENTSTVIKEMYRVLKPNGIAEIIVPHFSNIGSYHWSHKTFWNARGLDFVEINNGNHYYCPTVNFKILTRNIEFSEKRTYKPTFFEKIVSKRNTLYERFISSIIRAYQIRIIMKKI